MPPVLEELVAREIRPEELNVLFRRSIKAAFRNDLLRLLRFEAEIPVSSPMVPCPVLYALEIAARVRRRKPREYALVDGHIDVEWNRRDIRMAHDGLS